MAAPSVNVSYNVNVRCVAAWTAPLATSLGRTKEKSLLFFMTWNTFELKCVVYSELVLSYTL